VDAATCRPTNAPVSEFFLQLHNQETKVCRYSWHSAGSLRWPFPMLKNKRIFSNKIYRINFIKQRSETVMVWNYQNADCSLKK